MMWFRRKPKSNDALPALKAQQESLERREVINEQAQVLDKRLRGPELVNATNHIYEAVLRTLGGST